MKNIQYRLIRSNRKTLAIHVTKSAEIEVRAPLDYPEKQIKQLLEANEHWIRTRLAKISEQLEKKQNLKLEPLERLPFLGTEYPVAYSAPGERRLAFNTTRFILPDAPFDELKPLLITLYKKMLRPVIKARVQHWAEIMKVTPSSVKINGAMKRWGSCSGKNALNFSWMLAMADKDAVDYVVVHELAHISEKNHSERFWAIVQPILPDYKATKKKLDLLYKDICDSLF